MITKGEIVNGAYDKLEISGLTSNPNPKEISMGLKNLDAMMAAWTSESIHVGYKLSDSIIDVDPSDDSGLTTESYLAVELNLSCRLAYAFGKAAPPHLLTDAKQMKDMLYSVELIQREQDPYQPSGRGLSYDSETWDDFMTVDNAITIEYDGTLEDLS